MTFTWIHTNRDVNKQTSKYWERCYFLFCFDVFACKNSCVGVYIQLEKLFVCLGFISMYKNTDTKRNRNRDKHTNTLFGKMIFRFLKFDFVDVFARTVVEILIDI